MIERIDHVALAVQNATEACALFSKLFGFQAIETLEDTESGFLSLMIAKEGVKLELLQPLGSDGIIQRFIEKRGGGLHHISIQVDDLEKEMIRLKSLGVQFVNEEPKQVSGSKIVFVHPRSSGGLLIELTQNE